MFLFPNIEKLQAARQNMALSKHQLSLKAGLSGCALSRIESGKTSKIHELRAREIARALNCRVEDIFSTEKANKISP